MGVLTKDTVFEGLEVNGIGQITGHYRVSYLDDGVEEHAINKSNFYDVEDDVSNTPTIFQNVATAVWTPAIVQNRLDQLNNILTDSGEPTETTLADAKAAVASLDPS